MVTLLLVWHIVSLPVVVGQYLGYGDESSVVLGILIPIKKQGYHRLLQFPIDLKANQGPTTIHVVRLKRFEQVNTQFQGLFKFPACNVSGEYITAHEVPGIRQRPSFA